MKTNFRNNCSENLIKDVDETATIEIWMLKQNQTREFIADEHSILLVIEGCFNCSLQGYINEDIRSGHMILVPVGIRCCINTSEKVSIICLKPGLVLSLNNYSFYKNTQETVVFKISNKQPILEFTPLIETYIESLKIFLELGFNDRLYIYLKTREFFHLMYVSYTIDQRTQFFNALVSKNKEFSDFIHKNYRQAESIRDLAALCCLSLSGFEKRFRKVFGVSALHWITSKRAADIYQEICHNKKSIKQISSDYGFSSVSHFHRFCKDKLGLSPGDVRRQAQGL